MAMVFWLLAIWVLLLLGAMVWGIDNAETTLREITAAAPEAAVGSWLQLVRLLEDERRSGVRVSGTVLARL